MRINFAGKLLMGIVPFSMACGSVSEQAVYSSERYQIFPDRVVQGNYVAKAVSASEIVSDYQSPANPYKKSIIDFKFAINGKDNEMVSGVDHHFNVLGSEEIIETPLIKFGEPLSLGEHEQLGYIKPNTKLKVRLDLREVLAAFDSKGYYVLFNGDRLAKEDFKTVYIAGSSSPMTWDFGQLTQHPDLELKDMDGDGIYEVLLEINQDSQSKDGPLRWKVSKDLSTYPVLQSGYPLADAVYKMSLEEMLNAVEPDSTFRTGKEWAGVWTRDISYSIILSMAEMQPEVSKISLLKKVNNKKKIVQDTGTGGAWPVSSDRMIWAAAAWKIYVVTGDQQWLEQAYTIISNSLEDDYPTLYDAATGLVKGESSFLDWREQTYPSWMQPADIFESRCLSTNAIHYEANRIAAKMAFLLDQSSEAAKFNRMADKIKEAINQHLWMPSKKYYAQYLYGRGDYLRSSRSDALGEALSVLFDIATPERQREIVSNTPVTTYGIPCIYPDIPGIPPYHNNGVWPFVQAFWMKASAKSSNQEAVLESMAAIYRPAALFLTNKENFVAENGDFKGTQINSSNMLWSLAGNIAMVHTVLFGLHHEENGLAFRPFVPSSFSGKRVLSNFRYRNAVLNIEMEGHGNEIESFYLNGVKMEQPFINRELTGSYDIIIKLNGAMPKQPIHKVQVSNSLPEPKLGLDRDNLYWLSQASVKQFKLYRNGELIKVISPAATNEKIDEEGRYQLVAVDEAGAESFASEPIEFFSKELSFSVGSTTTGQGKSNNGEPVNITIEIAKEGIYDIDVEYANGNGPVNTDNKCVIRTLFLDQQRAGVLVFPQRGKENWTDFGFSNSLRLKLTKGTHLLSIEYRPFNENMSGEVNKAIFKRVRIRKL